jgi:hypothetical protein
VDDWPHIKPGVRPAADAIAAIAHRLHSTSTSTLPESFERPCAAPALTVDAALMLVDTALQQTKADGRRDARRAGDGDFRSRTRRDRVARPRPRRRRDDPSP